MNIIQIILDISVLLFPIASMFAVGLSFTLNQITRPLRFPDRVFRALVANFILVPLLAVGISRLLALETSLAAGVVLVGTAAGAPFLLKLTQVANGDVSLSATLLVLLMPLTVFYMPFAVPLVIADASVNAVSIAVPLILTLLLPLIVGQIIGTVLPRLASHLALIAAKTSSVSLLTLVISTVILNASLFRDMIGTGAIIAAILLTAGGFGAGYLISSSGFNRRATMGLGTGQRNIAAALVVATQDFNDPRMLAMIVLFSVVDLMVLFPIAFILRRRSPPPDIHKSDSVPLQGPDPGGPKLPIKENP